MIANKREQIWFVDDVCGMVCCVFSWVLLGYAQYAVLTCVILPEPDTLYKTINLIIFETLLFLSTVSHFKCVFVDPGSVPLGFGTREFIEETGFNQDQVIYKCQKCCNIKPSKSHHCSVCNRCIMRMDHHCPWINNCVGLRNRKYFMLFTLYIALVSAYTLMITMIHLWKCFQNDWAYCDSRPLLSLFTSDYYSPPDPKRSRASAYSVVLIVFLILKALVFAIFTGVMFGVQAVAISKDETGIESKKKEKESLNKPATRFAMNRSIKRFRCILSGFQLNWLNPFTKPPKHSSFKSPNDFV